MAKTKISEFSSTPANNTDIDSINIAEGCAPSGINDAIRELMSQLKDFQTGAQGDSFNGPIGSTTASTGAFTTLTTTGNAGVGTSSPAARLHSTSSSNQLTISEGSSLGATFDYQSSTGNLSIATNGINARSSAQLVLNLNGNLGLGVTPSASDFKTLQVGYAGSGLLATGQNDLILASNAYYASGWKYGGSAKANYFELDTGSFKWYQTNTSGTAGNAITFTQAMTLDASGNLIVGGTAATNTSSGRGNITINGSSTAILSMGTGGTAKGYIYHSGSDMIVNATTGTLALQANGSGALIDSSGNLLVGTTSTSGSSGGTSGSVFTAGTSFANLRLFGTGTQTFAQFLLGGTTVGTIVSSGSTTNYNTSSDYRLKNTIAPMTGALAKVAQLKPVTYKWNADGSDGEGFIAHELAEVCPQAVTGEKDAVDEDGNPQYQGIDVSFLVATLTAAIQELKAEFDAYKASHP